MSEPLVLSFKSDTNDARNAIANLASSVVTNMMAIGSAMKAANDNMGTLQSGMQALPTILRTAAAGFIAFEAAKLSLQAVSAAAEAAREKLAEIVKVADDAKAAGVGTNFLQQWTHDAQTLNVEAERAAAMLSRARDAATVHLGTGGNASSSAIQDLLGQHVAAGNISSGDLASYNAADSQEARIRVVLDLIDKLRASSRELAAFNIGDKMFGPEFSNQLRNGVDLVNQMRSSLTSIQDVKFPPDIVENAKHLDEEFKKAQDRLEHGWAPVQQDILRWQQSMLTNVVNLKLVFADIVEILGQWYTNIKGIADVINGLGNSDFLHGINQWMADRGLLSVPLYPTGGVPQGEQYGPFPPQGPNLPEHQLTVGGGRRDRSNPLLKKPEKESDTDEVDTYIKSLEKAVKVLEAENETFGKSNTLKAEAVDLEKAMAAARTRGTDLTDKERAEVKRLADEEGRAKDKAEELQKSLAGANERATFLGDQAISAIERIGQSGVRAKDVILDFAKALEKAALQAALLGTGPLAQLFGMGGSGGNVGGLFGGLFGGSGLFSGMGAGSAASSYASAAAAAGPGMYGPGFASGGLVGRDGERTFIPFAALAGARHFATGGGIPAILHPGEIVLNAAQQGNVARQMSSGPTIQITHAPTINGSGLTPEQLAGVLEANNKRLARNIGTLQADWQRRHG